MADEKPVAVTDLADASSQTSVDEPEVILVGDSHTLALAQGCQALEISAALLKSGGIHWNQGKIRVFRARRRLTPLMPAMQPAVKDLQIQLGTTDIFDGRLPVIASIGIHNGHLARAFGAHGHLAWPPPETLSAEEESETLFASNALLDVFIENNRAPHFALLNYIAAQCKLTVVLPPRAPKNEHKIMFRHNIERLTGRIAERLIDMGLDVYDPNADIVGSGELLPSKWVNDDGFHGTPAYGKFVMQKLVARGALLKDADRKTLEK